MTRSSNLAAALLGGTLLAGPAAAQDVTGAPDALNIAITTFLTGPASVFGVPAQEGAQMLIERINADGGILGVPIEASFIDEGAGAQALTTAYRRAVENGADVMLASISSGNCTQLAPLAEDLQVLNIMWDCGTQRIFEEADYEYVFRTQANATPEMLAAVLYVIDQLPEFETIAVVNQDYAWGRDSWDIFSTALMALKPEVEVVGEFFPAFGAPDFSTEISRLSAVRPDVILSTSWGGDLDTFVQQAAQRGLMNQSTFVLPLAESSLERLGDALPEGVIVGARGDHFFRHPEMVGAEEFDNFVAQYRERTGSYPIYSVFHMVQAFAALEAAYEKAAADNGNAWPDTEQVIAAMEGLTFRGFGREVTIREDHQGVEAQMMGTTATDPDLPFKTLTDVVIYDGTPLTTPVGRESIEWIGTLTADFPGTVEATTFD